MCGELRLEMQMSKLTSAWLKVDYSYHGLLVNGKQAYYWIVFNQLVTGVMWGRGKGE